MLRALLLFSVVAVSAGCGGGSGGGTPVVIFAPNFASDGVAANATGGSTSAEPRLCCNGLNVYAVWQDDRNGNEDIYLNVSRDGGLTWGAGDIRLDTGDAAGSARSLNPDICCDGDRVYVVWHDDRNGANDIYFNASFDGGATWQPSATRVDHGTAGSAVSEFPQVCCAGLDVYVAWLDQRLAAPRRDVFTNASTDGGATWGANDVRIDTRDGDSDGLRICCAGQNVYAVWSDKRNGAPDIHYNSSANGGATWQASDVRLDTGDIAGRGASLNPQICCDGLDVYVAWQDDRNDLGGNQQIFAHNSADGGVTWPVAPRRVDNGTGDADDPVLCCERNTLFVAWRDDRDGATDIYVNVSVNRGITWRPVDARLDTGDTAGASESRGPRIGCAGSVTYVVWADRRDGAGDIYVNWSADNGSTWQAMDQRIDGATGAGAADSDGISLCSDGPRLYVAWEESRNPGQDVFVNANR